MCPILTDEARLFINVEGGLEGGAEYNLGTQLLFCGVHPNPNPEPPNPENIGLTLNPLTREHQAGQ